MFKIIDHITNALYDTQNDRYDILDIIEGLCDEKSSNTVKTIAETAISNMTFGDKVSLKLKHMSIDLEIICFDETKTDDKSDSAFDPLLVNSKRPDCIGKDSYVYWVNPKYDMKEIRNSMLIRPNETIAYYIGYNGVVSIEVRGNINFTYTPNDMPDMHYKYVDPSQYTDDVIKAINNYPEEHKMPGSLNIEEDNWFEMFYTPYDENGNLRSDYTHCDVEPECCTLQELVDIMKEYYDSPY